MLTVLHASDLQCGRPFRPKAAEALVHLSEAVAPDVVVISGDLTQRAKDREYRVVNELLERMPRVPTVLTPGNHDVPLYRLWERLFTPYLNWHRHISAQLDSVTKLGGSTIVALNSSAPRRAIVNGRIDDDQVELARRAFSATPPSDIRALVIHHHFVPVPDGKAGKPLPRASYLLSEFEAMGADVVLGGHVHQTHVTTSSDLLGPRPRPGIPLIACGTTTSWRGRGPEADLNSLNVVRIRQSDIEVVPHLMTADGDGFEPRDPIVFPRRTPSGRSGVASTEGVG